MSGSRWLDLTHLLHARAWAPGHDLVAEGGDGREISAKEFFSHRRGQEDARLLDVTISVLERRRA